ncbi:hypothetical protein G6F46_007034 [Rhizopus delemar]|nr:hypothetical protein G6F55_011244 [Rhizopus delemar]KAG1536407.1 hypothetical protein G6F51_010990 [Rhizopus arrhizus]KAG1497444.1 hypothetical protein G6F54_005759 [Rhizopus delemar]KAG1511476.1 hypothetical protein G6F53_005909 [Rhizopus delemar]KAG1514672.1 hypothetical protein G6F52_009862 [Rhizopus delemar]
MIQEILKRKHASAEETMQSLSDLRNALSTQPCPPMLREKVWILLLDVRDISASSYINLVELGPSTSDDQIRNDAFRTMATDANFLERVSEDMLIRLLNALVWKKERESTPSPSNACQQSGFTYLQGMNALAAPFLMCMPEMSALFAFSEFIGRWCPLYVQPNMRGVHCGIRATIMTFSACTPPLSELLELWDYMFAHGIHLNILFVIAQMLMMRADILNSPSPCKILRVWPPLRAQQIIKMTKSLSKALPSDLHQKLVHHASDESIADQLGIAANITELQHVEEDLPAYLRDT